MSLEQELEGAFRELGISKKQQTKLKYYICLIEKHDISTYNHLTATGLKLMGAVDDKKAGLYCGLLHDIGKLWVDKKTLKKEDFNEKDMEKLKDHPISSFLILGNDFAFSALVSLLHHQNQDNSYPILKNIGTIIGSKNPASLEKARQYARILHTIDAGDARMYRNNNYNELNKDKI